jgi:Holliday junction DNA helicase RuvA
MIGKLTGKVDSVSVDNAIIDVNGVGYLVQASSATLARLTQGASVALHIETKVSEDAIRLYGFLAAEEREWFRLLQTVQGVGARVALSVLSALKPNELHRAIVLGDKGAIGRAQGVGPKLAQRIAAELKEKAPAILLARSPGEADDSNVAPIPVHAPNGVEADAIAALVKLGYSQMVASETVARAANTLGPNADALPLDALLRESLRQMAR